MKEQKYKKVLVGGPARNAKRIVLAGGVFDILHFGHVEFLRKAKALGDILVVALESDANVKRLKGSRRPIQSQDRRRKILESLRFVDKVIILKDKMTDADYRALVNKVRPSVVAVTAGDPMFKKKMEQAAGVGAKIAVIPKVKEASTTRIAKLLKFE